MRALLAIGLLPLALLLGCADEPLTTEQGCSGGEVSAEIASFAPTAELLLIVEPELAAKLRPRLLALLRAFATGEVFGDTGDGVMSICGGDYRPVLEMASCGGFLDAGTWHFDSERIAREADGRADCRNRSRPVSGSSSGTG